MQLILLFKIAPLIFALFPYRIDL